MPVRLPPDVEGLTVELLNGSADITALPAEADRVWRETGSALFVVSTIGGLPLARSYAWQVRVDVDAYHRDLDVAHLAARTALAVIEAAGRTGWTGSGWAVSTTSTALYPTRLHDPGLDQWHWLATYLLTCSARSA